MKKGKVLIIQLSLAFLLMIGLITYAFISFNADSSDAFIEESGLIEENTIVDTAEPVPQEQTVTAPVAAPSEETEEASQDYDITLMAVGDNLLHMGIVNTGKQTDGTYDYSFLFRGISEFLDLADIKIINQETIFGGNELGFSGFPAFNSPTEVGDAIASAGFNVVLHASNHSADKKLKGIKNCAAFWKNHPEVLITGIHESPEESEVIPVLTIGDVTFAILNYSYSANLETLPASIEGHLNILCQYDENYRMDFTTINPDVLEDIAYAETIADVVIVCPHWGTEYTSKPSSYQEKFAKQMTEAGADLIIGTHPHVVKPVQWVTSENGNRALCFYSLGNYVSTQKNGLSMLEAMAWVTFHVTEDSVTISDKNTGVIPMVCQYTSNPVRFENVYFLEDYTEELAASHGIHSYGGVDLKLADLRKWSRDILGDWVLSKAQVLSK